MKWITSSLLNVKCFLLDSVEIFAASFTFVMSTTLSMLFLSIQTEIDFFLVTAIGVDAIEHGLWICDLTSARLKTSIVSALLLIRLKISVLFMSTIFTLSMKMIKSPLSKCDLSAGEPGKTDFMKHGLVQIMFDSNPNSWLKFEKLVEKVKFKSKVPLLFSLLPETLCDCENGLAHFVQLFIAKWPFEGWTFINFDFQKSQPIKLFKYLSFTLSEQIVLLNRLDDDRVCHFIIVIIPRKNRFVNIKFLNFCIIGDYFFKKIFSI